jgi:excinuclease UvrABC nuclease subunit
MELDPRQWQSVLWDKAQTIPATAGCYALIDTNDTILYIGRSKILWNRLRNPFNHPGFKRVATDCKYLKIAWYEGWEAYDSERRLIIQWKPTFCKERIKRKG